MRKEKFYMNEMLNNKEFNKYFNGFMLFLAIIFILVFWILGVNFLISAITGLIMVIVIRGLYILYGLMMKLVSKVDLKKIRKATKNEKREV